MAHNNVFFFGLGSIGGVYSSILKRERAGVTVTVTMCARTNYDVVKAKGIHFKSVKYGEEQIRFDQVVRSPSEARAESFDYVVITNKAVAASPSVVEQIAPVVSKDTVICIIQNGVGNADPFRDAFPGNVILSAVTWCGASQPELGTISHFVEDSMQIGVEWNDDLSRDLQQEKLDSFVSLLERAGSKIEVVSSIGQWRWKKTIWNAMWNTLTALTLCNTKKYLESSEAACVTAKALRDEMAAIARGLGHSIDDDYLDSLIERKDLRDGGIFSSMYADACAQHPMEVEVILGAPLRYAKELGLTTPVLETCFALLTAMGWRFQNGVKR